MDVPIAELIKGELVVHIGLYEGVRVEVEAGHPYEHFEHGDVILLNLHLQCRDRLESSKTWMERFVDINFYWLNFLDFGQRK